MQVLCHAAEALSVLESPTPKPLKLRMKKKMKIEKELLGMFSPVKKSGGATTNEHFPLKETTNTSNTTSPVSNLPKNKKSAKPKFIKLDDLIRDDKENGAKSSRLQMPNNTIQVNVHSQDNNLKRKFDLINDSQTQQCASPQRIKIRRVQNGQISSRPTKSSLVYQF
jgi:hypothetical protein